MRRASFLVFLAATAAATSISGVAAGRQSVAAPPAPRPEQFGNFTLINWRSVVTLFGKNTTTFDATALRGQRITAKSPDYEMTAADINLRFDKPAAQRSRYKATRGEATGNVRIVVREPQQNRTTVLTCASALYTATLTPTDRGKIQLRGGVRSETNEPGAGSFVQQSQTGVVEFLPNGALQVTLDAPQGGSVRGTLVEPAPRPKNPGP